MITVVSVSAEANDTSESLTLESPAGIVIEFASGAESRPATASPPIRLLPLTAAMALLEDSQRARVNKLFLVTKETVDSRHDKWGIIISGSCWS